MSREAAGEQLVKLKLDDLVVDEAIQSRVAIDSATVERYCDEFRDGAKFPPLRAVKDCKDGTFWLWEGFHRRDMYAALKQLRVDVLVRNGTKLDAVKLSAGSNADHGLPRSSEDKERSVLMLLAQDELRNSSVKELASIAKVSWPFAQKVRDQHIGTPARIVDKNGRERSGVSASPVKKADKPIDTAKLEELGVATPAVPLPRGVVEDEYNRPVPQTLEAVFTDARELKAIAIEAASLRSRFNKAVRRTSRAGACISIAAADKAIAEFNATIHGGRPRCVCPACDGVPSSDDAEPCEHCEGRLWLPEARIASLPKPLRQKVEQHLRSDA